MTTTNLTAETIEAMAAEAARGFYKGFAITDLKAALERVENPTNWKMALAGIIPFADVEKTTVAAEFYCGSPLRVVYTEPVIAGRERQCCVTGPGYYACIGA